MAAWAPRRCRAAEASSWVLRPSTSSRTSGFTWTSAVRGQTATRIPSPGVAGSRYAPGGFNGGGNGGPGIGGGHSGAGGGGASDVQTLPSGGGKAALASRLLVAAGGGGAGGDGTLFVTDGGIGGGGGAIGSDGRARYSANSALIGGGGGHNAVEGAGGRFGDGGAVSAGNPSAYLPGNDGAQGSDGSGGSGGGGAQLLQCPGCSATDASGGGGGGGGGYRGGGGGGGGGGSSYLQGGNFSYSAQAHSPANGSVELYWGPSAFLHFLAGAAVVGPPVATATPSGPAVTAPVACRSGRAATCTIRLTLSVTEHRHQKAIGAATATAAAGSYTDATIAVDAAGKRILRRRHAVSVTLSVRRPRGRRPTAVAKLLLRAAGTT